MIFFFEKNFLEKNSWKYAFIFLEIFFSKFFGENFPVWCFFCRDKVWD